MPSIRSKGLQCPWVVSVGVTGALIVQSGVGLEQTNLRNNLPLWEGIIDYYVIGIDSKTTDGSEAAIAEILPPSTPRSVYHFDFDGFGHVSTPRQLYICRIGLMSDQNAGQCDRRSLVDREALRKTGPLKLSKQSRNAVDAF